MFDHSEGKSVLGIQYITAVVSGREGIFPLNLDLKTKNGLSRIAMQMAVIKRSITADLLFSTFLPVDQIPSKGEEGLDRGS